MKKLPWTAWHKVVGLREDIRVEKLSLSSFAADLYDVAMGKAGRIYQKPEEFFALTYPTFNLRELAKDILHRLAAKNDKTVRQLELTYGGGKTHTLITLLHLTSDPAKLPDLPAVQEFVQHAGLRPPKARVVVLPFDKLDVEKGMEAQGPKGEKRWLRNPWSLMAYQIAGDDGLRLLHADGKAEERDSAPAENLLRELLARPEKEGLATLVLIDEVLMYARGKVGHDPAWRGKLVDFFQYLTQAATKVDRCAIVASLLATDPGKSDMLGKEITQELYAIFRREREEGVQPVLKEDVAEVLRRRFFTADSIRDRESFRPHVVAALKGITELDEQTRKDAQSAEERFLKSYPFHPDLTDVFYSKWTNLEGFQRTRGILRTFALGLRDAEAWDECPLVGPNVFLGRPGAPGVSEAGRELTTVAATEEYEGKRQEWTGILEGETEKARGIQADYSALRHRELEQAVFATFLHSQPIGQRSLTREIFVLLGSTRPDRIELEKALRRWTETSWFLDEGAVNDADVGADGRKQLPKSWRLGSKPNLRQMHHDAQGRVSPDLVEAKLLDEIGKLKSLTAGAAAAGARVHNLPEKPRNIEDDGEFHFGVLGPKAASETGKPSPEARRFLEETTGANRPRIYRNAVVLAVPSREALDVTRGAIRDYLAWEEVRSQLERGDLDPIREATLLANLDTARKRVPDGIRQAYSVVVTVSEKNDVQAFKVTAGDDPLFTTIKADPRSRIQETAVNADALLPDGPYDLWREGETFRRVKDLVGAFAQFPHLPKMLSRSAILDTVVLGCREGHFVLRATRPDRSVRTLWRQEPDESDLKDPGLEVVLPSVATLSELTAALLLPGVLPDLWAGPELPVKNLRSYFSGDRIVKVNKGRYDEPVRIPKAEAIALDVAIREAVKAGSLWLTSGPASVLGEEIPAGVLTEDAVLQAPPSPVGVYDLLIEKLPEAWDGQATTALGLALALSKRAGKTLPWPTVGGAIDGALRAGLLELTVDSGAWPCGYGAAQTVRLRLKSGIEIPPSPPPPPAGQLSAEADLSPAQIQDLADVIGDIASVAVGHQWGLRVHFELGGEQRPPVEVVNKVSEILRGISKDLDLA